ncbi:ArdC family protein [Dactylosporangium sp. NPDC049140]|uniref:ArdC family protein n=1 Tax=Dactylosporangium sp. NPDC049140 TaxID=3155647 RepID=UPI00340D7AC8
MATTRKQRQDQPTDEEREALLAKIKADFDQRLASIASDPHQWVRFLEQVAVFGARYSLGNQMLLLMQAEERGVSPQFFLPFGNRQRRTGWFRHDRQVRKGETGFKVWAAIKRRPTDEQVREWEAAGRKVRRDPDGRPSIQVVGFRLQSTFELSQTDGEPFEVPTVQRLRRQRLSSAGAPQLLDGDDPTDAFDDTVKLIKDAGYGFELAAPGSRYLGSANGVTVGGEVMLVKVRDDVSTAQRLKTTMHELAHIRCEHCTGTRVGEDLHRGRRETEAESVAYIVCKALGLDTAAYSDAYVLGWADGDMDLVKQCAETVLRVAKQILTELTPTATGASADADADDLPEPAPSAEPAPGAAIAAARPNPGSSTASPRAEQHSRTPAAM